MKSTGNPGIGPLLLRWSSLGVAFQLCLVSPCPHFTTPIPLPLGVTRGPQGHTVDETLPIPPNSGTLLPSPAHPTPTPLESSGRTWDTHCREVAACLPF